MFAKVYLIGMALYFGIEVYRWRTIKGYTVNPAIIAFWPIPAIFDTVHDIDSLIKGRHSE